MMITVFELLSGVMALVIALLLAISERDKRSLISRLLASSGMIVIALTFWALAFKDLFPLSFVSAQPYFVTTAITLSIVGALSLFAGLISDWRAAPQTDRLIVKRHLVAATAYFSMFVLMTIMITTVSLSGMLHRINLSYSLLIWLTLVPVIAYVLFFVTLLAVASHWPSWAKPYMKSTYAFIIPPVITAAIVAILYIPQWLEQGTVLQQPFLAASLALVHITAASALWHFGSWMILTKQVDTVVG